MDTDYNLCSYTIYKKKLNLGKDLDLIELIPPLKDVFRKTSSGIR